MKLTFGFALTANDPGAAYTAHSLLLHHGDVADEIELVVVDNSAKGSDRASFLEKEIGQIPNARYIRDLSPPSSYLPRNRVFAEATGDVVICCDSHVLFEAGAIRALMEYFRQHPDSNDLISGPLLRCGGKVSATQQTIYGWEGVSEKDLMGHGVRVFGTWLVDRRGLDPTGPPFEIMKTGLGAFACRREAWPGFHESFSGYGGGEVYLCEKFRQRGSRVLCLPSLRWWHNFMGYDQPAYSRDWKDWARNMLTTAVELDRADLFDAAVTQLRARAPAALDAVLPQFARPPGLVPYRPPPLPGFALKRLFREQAPEVEAGPACNGLAYEMNRRGSADCRANVDLLVRTILPRARRLAARRHPRAVRALDRLGPLCRKATDAAICSRLRRHVLQACNVAEREMATR